MKKIFAVFASLLLLETGKTQSSAAAPTALLGKIQKSDLLSEQFANWFVSGFDSYQPNQKLTDELRKQVKPSLRFEIFLGTWCGDSRREVPRFMKLLDELGFPLSRVQLIALGGSDSFFKQSPQHEEAGKGIFRVPTIIVYDDAQELNRINEYPCLSLEHDLLAIVTGQPYTPNYKSFSVVKKWMADSSLLNENISARSLASALRGKTEGAYELNGLGYLMQQQNKRREALKTFLINQQLYPESVSAFTGAGKCYVKNGDTSNAILMFEKALELNKDPGIIKEILSLLDGLAAVKPHVVSN